MSALGSNPATISVPTRNRLTFEQGERSVSTISTGGFRGARLTRTRGGTDTTVVYTDREASRRLLDHFGVATTGADAARFDATNSALPDVVEIELGTTDLTDRPWSISRPSDVGSTLRTDGTGDTTDEGQARESISGSLYGITGRFECGTGCTITPTGTYTDPDDTTTPTVDNAETWRLETLTIAVSTGVVVYFRPNSAATAVSLCADVGVGSSQCAADDSEYMAFGWWRQDPASSLGSYDFGVFANVMGGTANGLSGTAEYDGTAVGMYVEQARSETSDITRQGGIYRRRSPGCRI